MSSDIVGSIKLKTMLSGMPELRLGLNDRVLFALSGRACTATIWPPSPVTWSTSVALLMLTFTPVFMLCSGDKGKTVMMEDVKFHQCVRLSRFESDRTISFIPPDGESELMSYRINTHVSPPQCPLLTTMWYMQLEYLYIILTFTMDSCASFPCRWSLWYGLSQW